MSFLTRKYPFPQSSHWLRDCTLFCGIVFMILYFLQPFGFNYYQGNKFLVSLIFGAIAFCCCYVYGKAIKPLYRIVSPWRVWHESLVVLVMVLFVGICNFFASSFIFYYPITLGNCLLFLYQTMIIGVIITIFSVGITYHKHLRSQLEALIDKTTDQQTGVTITLHDNKVRGNDLLIPINDLLYVEAQKNNVVVCFAKGEDVQKTELHTTLSAVLDELNDYGNIFRCHRSFVVNLNNITSAQGNSNGYRLLLGKCPTVVPVSRTYVPKLRSFIS